MSRAAVRVAAQISAIWRPDSSGESHTKTRRVPRAARPRSVERVQRPVGLDHRRPLRAAGPHEPEVAHRDGLGHRGECAAQPPPLGREARAGSAARHLARHVAERSAWLGTCARSAPASRHASATSRLDASTTTSGDEARSHWNARQLGLRCARARSTARATCARRRPAPRADAMQRREADADARREFEIEAPRHDRACRRAARRAPRSPRQ